MGGWPIAATRKAAQHRHILMQLVFLPLRQVAHHQNGRRASERELRSRAMHRGEVSFRTCLVDFEEG
jgi:hypothetical protein